MSEPKTDSFKKAVNWARGLHDPDSPIDFPDLAHYVQLAAKNADIDVDAHNPDENLFHELPEEYELAYLTVKLERMKERIKQERGVDLDEA
jgi:hypothetical protein